MDCVNRMKAMYPNQDVDALKKKVIKEKAIQKIIM
mgnify:CR=1 FL=1